MSKRKFVFKLMFSSAAILLGLAVSQAAFAQSSSTFADANVEYTFQVPEERWKMTVKPTPTNPNVEFVFVDRLDGHFEVRKSTARGNALMSDVIRDEETKLQFLPGFVAGREENFGGKLNGSVYNFEFVRAGRPMSGRFYFLRAGETVYVLRFTGFRDKLRTIKNQTDSIARTFGMKD